MQRRFLILCLLSSVGFFSSRAAAVAVLDQDYQPPIDLANLLNEGFPYSAQVVTAGKTGYLTRADLNVDSVISFPDWLVTVNAVHAGVPTGTILTSQLVPTNSSSSLEIDFSSPAFFDAGDSFALVISAPSLPPHQFAGVWSGSFDHPYPSGGLGFNSPDGANFTPISTAHPGSALAFDTYVSVPEPTSLVALAVPATTVLLRRKRVSK